MPYKIEIKLLNHQIYINSVEDLKDLKSIIEKWYYQSSEIKIKRITKGKQNEHSKHNS